MLDETTCDATMVDEFDAFIDEKVSWLIEDVIMEDETFFLYGAEQQGKTFIATSLAVALVLGRPWMGREVTKSSQVIYIPTESRQDVAQRLQAVRNEMYQTSICGVRLLKTRRKMLPSDPDGRPSLLIEEVAFLTTPDPKSIVLIIDNLKDLIDGDINSQRDVQRAIDAINELRRLGNGKGFTFTVIVVHHSGKDADRGMLGSSILAAASATRARVRRGVFEVEKNRFSDERPTINFDLELASNRVAYAVPARHKRATKPGAAPKPFDVEMIVLGAATKEVAMRAFYEAEDAGDPALPDFDSVSFRGEPRKGRARNVINKAVNKLVGRGAIACDANGNIRRITSRA